MSNIAIKDLTDIQANCGRVSYNGVIVPNIRNLILRSKQVYDKAKRTIIKTQYSLMVSGYLFSAASPTDSLSSHEDSVSAKVAAIRQGLSQPGKRLRITDSGWGDLVINDNSVAIGSIGGNADTITPETAVTHYDIDWGPRPGDFEVISAGGTVAMSYSWSIEFTIFENPGNDQSGAESAAAKLFNRFVAVNYDCDFDVDSKTGLTTRSIAGEFEIPIARQGASRAEYVTADQAVQYLRTAVPYNFERTAFKTKLSDDRKTIRFSIVDKELSGPAPFPGLVKCRAAWNIASTDAGQAKWTASISGTVEPSPVHGPGFAAGAVIEIMSRFSRELNTLRGNEGVAIPIGIQFAGDLWERERRFTLVYLVTGCLQDRIFGSSLWAPINTDYNLWATSMQPLWQPRGLANMQVQPSSTAIIDLAHSGISGNTPLISGGRTFYNAGGSGNGFYFPLITPQNSWLYFANRIEFSRDHQIVEHEPAIDFVGEAFAAANGDIGGQVGGVTLTPPPGGVPESVIQRNGAPVDEITMIGQATRIFYPPVVPKLRSIGGIKVKTEITTKIDGPRVLGCFFGKHVYNVRWFIRYKLEKQATAIQAMPDPSLCCAVPNTAT